VLDEGLFVLEGFLEGIERPVCAIGVAEKGSAQVALSATAEGGHSSMPPEHTAVGRVARAVALLEAHPMPAAIDPPASLLFDTLLADFPFPQRLALANRWLTRHLVLTRLSRAPSTNALLRTTAAATILDGGEVATALPTSARALVNFRIHPRDSVQEVLEHVIQVVDDPDVTVELLRSDPPSPISPAEGAAWDLLAETCLQVFSEARVAPALCIAGTDARHYTDLTPYVYRFLPLRLTPEEAERIHGVGERIRIASYLEMIRFYSQLLANL
jgi:carboxypeptidase PM20D1